MTLLTKLRTQALKAPGRLPRLQSFLHLGAQITCNQLELLQSGLQVFHNLLGNDLGRRQGIAVGQGIILGLGGKITVETQLGKGTCFRVLLAATTQDRVEVVASKAPPMADASRRVLVVDDEPLIGKAVKRILGSAHQVTAVTSGRAALELLNGGQTFDVILCDLMMPEMTGIELYQHLLEHRPADANGMVFVTGGAFTEQAREFLDEVSNSRLEKPFDHQTLRNLVVSAR